MVMTDGAVRIGAQRHVATCANRIVQMQPNTTDSRLSAVHGAHPVNPAVESSRLTGVGLLFQIHGCGASR